MKYFIYKQERIKKFKKEITVYHIENNMPSLVGAKIVDTRAFKGERTTAKEIICEKFEEITMTDGYYIDQEIVLELV